MDEPVRKRGRPPKVVSEVVEPQAEDTAKLGEFPDNAVISVPGKEVVLNVCGRQIIRRGP